MTRAPEPSTGCPNCGEEHALEEQTPVPIPQPTEHGQPPPGAARRRVFQCRECERRFYAKDDGTLMPSLRQRDGNAPRKCKACGGGMFSGKAFGDSTAADSSRGRAQSFKTAPVASVWRCEDCGAEAASS